MSIQLLHIDTSIFGESGVSSQLGQTLLKHLNDRGASADIVHRDLASDPIPHFDADTIARIGEGEEVLADTLIKEVQAADVIVLGVPMYNFGVPSALKAWFDHIARAGTTFRYTDSGPEGLLNNKKVFVLTSRGGVHRDQPSDSQTLFLKTMLGFLGLEDVSFIYAEGLNMSGGIREEAIAKAEAEIEHHIRTLADTFEEVA